MVRKLKVMANAFNSSLLGCFSDTKICCLGIFCLPYLSSRNKADVDERDCTICDFLCCPREYFTRLQIRTKYGFEQNTVSDCITTSICLPCSTCQDARELEERDTIIR
ncbi:duf614 family protein-related [Anaeramoeba flamelloides]|uniref:Duf614 family protein-related n=1 Tax=Anaeramoeba flamelloides TaxID=1746091 RepID=A0ABQ8XUG8_9EUKA|nr:duf614 family protein-related [Anaeramoeba flamelloides]